jgi:hypothetical protein
VIVVGIVIDRSSRRLSSDQAVPHHLDYDDDYDNDNDEDPSAASDQNNHVSSV